MIFPGVSWANESDWHRIILFSGRIVAHKIGRPALRFQGADIVLARLRWRHHPSQKVAESKVAEASRLCQAPRVSIDRRALRSSSDKEDTGETPMLLWTPAHSHSGCTIKLARQTETGSLCSSRRTRNPERGTRNRAARSVRRAYRPPAASCRNALSLR